MVDGFRVRGAAGLPVQDAVHDICHPVDLSFVFSQCEDYPPNDFTARVPLGKSSSWGNSSSIITPQPGDIQLGTFIHELIVNQLTAGDNRQDYSSRVIRRRRLRRLAGGHPHRRIARQRARRAWVGGFAFDQPRRRPDVLRAVFNFDFRALPEAGPDYTTFHFSGDEALLGGTGGMFGASDGTPSHWLVYFSVSDADTSAAEGHGGQVLAPPFDTPCGRRGAVVDPAGAVFWIAQTNADQPMLDRSG